jgi:uncharacterized spore protein YtfJ
MKVEELLAKVRESLGAGTVYAEPYEKDGVTVIAAASIVGGGGGGSGQEKEGPQGEGGGFGVLARPTGAYVIKDGRVSWQPVIDVNLLLAATGAIAVAGLWAAVRIVKIRSRASLSSAPRE